MFYREGDIEYLAQQLFSQHYPFRKWDDRPDSISGGPTQEEKDKFKDIARQQLSGWHPV